MAKKKSQATTTPVEATTHQDTRSHIPTRELGAMVTPADAAAKPLLYPRDPSLDPQLVWKGKDDQDGGPLTVPAVPIYIQEKILPQALIEDLRRRPAGEGSGQAELFADFDGRRDPATLTEFYRHDRSWTNRMILGDSLLVMASLAEKERLRGRVQTIYMDPPYGIKFGSNWQVSTRKRDVSDGKMPDRPREPEVIKAYRDTWELGVNSYLTYLRDRLTVARDLLTESGSIFVQIGDENVHLVRSVLDEVYGSENFLSLITFKKTAGATGTFLPGVTDYLVWYAKSREAVKYRRLYLEKSIGGAGGDQYTSIEFASGERRRASEAERLSPPPDARIFRLDNLTSQSAGREKGEGAASWFSVSFAGREFHPTMQTRWKTNEIGMSRLISARRVHGVANTLTYVRYLDDFPVMPIHNLWEDTVTSGFSDSKTYVVQTNTKVVERCLLMTTDPGDLVLDPTCGSGTTAYVAEQWGRRWITTDTSRVALALARTRLMAARFPFYLLADSPEGRKKEAELTGAPTPADAPPCGRDIRKGFVYTRVPHVTLKSIANNPDIKEGMTRAQIDAAIARHADTETLFDKPYEDRSTVRVTGPFTVESLSPHRVLPADDPAHATPAGSRSAADFVNAILANLRKAGVQNTKKGERLEFDRLDPYAGEFLSAEGTSTQASGEKRVAVCIGPEFGAVGPELIQRAAHEAHRGLPFDILIVCGFAFDPHTAEEGRVVERRIGNITVLLVRMNADLSMGDDLLKKTGAANLFTVFGEPDLAVEKQEDGRYVVEVRGVDVFDPTTSEIRSGDADDIACWMIDTDYDDESFLVRHAYFLGTQEPFEKLKRALKAEIDETAWSRLYCKRSAPFDRPTRGKIAVKVINHYGDEVLKVISLK